MRLQHTLTTAFRSLRAHKSRSILTILGIVIGIAAVILIVSIGKGAERLILGEIGGLGSETIVVRPGKQPQGPSDIAETLFSDSLKQRELDALKRKENVPDIADISPALIVPGSVAYGGETYRPTVLGWSGEFMAKTFNIKPEYGDFFTDTDIRQRSRVALIGTKVRDELFGNENPLDKNIKIKNQNFRVIGVFPQRGQLVFFNIDEMVLVPWSTAQTYLLGIDHFHEIIMSANSSEAVDRTVHDITITLRGLHNITDPSKDDFFVVTQEGLVDQIKTIVTALTIFLSSMVAISLLVGGIGIMNIMLVSVTERTREIGLRKAVGATEGNILSQFLLEAVMLTGIGGLLGIALGASLAFLTTFVLRSFFGIAWAYVVPISAAILGLLVSAATGLVFGIYPARKAAKENPIEALKYE